MVRLVFRPYAQVRKAICTSAHLRASTRVSSGFALLRHSSPSFGSHRARSDANHTRAKEAVGRRRRRPSTSLRPRASRARRLARALDSLVRVSRRVDRATRRRGRQARRTPGRAGAGAPTAPDGRRRPARSPPLAPLLRGRRPASGARRRQPREGIRRAHARRSSASLPTVSGTCHSLSKVLVTFPSRYLFAIGLPDVCSLGWDSPPDWGCTPKQPDSPEPSRAAGRSGGHGIVTLSDAAPQRTSPPRPAKNDPATPQLAERAIPGVGSARFARRYWGHPRSFLFLRLVICLSSAGSLVGRQVTSSSSSKGNRADSRSRARRRRSTRASERLAGIGIAHLSRADARVRGRPGRRGRPPRLGGRPLVVYSTLTPACSRPKPRAPCAFEDSMVHVGLQFTTHIAFRGVLHRPGSLAIHRRKFVTSKCITSLCTKQQNEREGNE